MGRAVGRSSIELAKTFDQVVGIDYSAPFIQIAFKMIEDNGRIRYSVPVEGDIQAFREISIDRLYEPMVVLGTIHERIVAGGFLVLLSRFT